MMLYSELNYCFLFYKQSKEKESIIKTKLLSDNMLNASRNHC